MRAATRQVMDQSAAIEQVFSLGERVVVRDSDKDIITGSRQW